MPLELCQGIYAHTLQHERSQRWTCVWMKTRKPAFWFSWRASLANQQVHSTPETCSDTHRTSVLELEFNFLELDSGLVTINRNP
jgi:hypothetical protein